jgi:hypothetical protein
MSFAMPCGWPFLLDHDVAAGILNKSSLHGAWWMPLNVADKAEAHLPKAPRPARRPPEGVPED